MTFVDGFYSFNFDLTNVDKDLYAKFRVKTAKHPHESFEHLYARMLAYVHSYEEGVKFTEGLFNLKEPTACKKDILDQLIVWMQVGVPEKKKLLKALRQDSNSSYLVYFFTDDQAEEFCHCLRGSRENWVEGVSFFRIPSLPLERLCQEVKSSSKWQVTIVDQVMYLVANEVEMEVAMTEIDIWGLYQKTIDNLDNISA